jgi:hypothetical protein
MCRLEAFIFLLINGYETALNSPYFALTQAFYRGTRQF